MNKQENTYFEKKTFGWSKGIEQDNDAAAPYVLFT